MTATSKTGNGLIVLGLALMSAAAIWLIVGRTALGAGQFAVGVVFLAVGLGSKRKANAAP